MSLTLKDGSVFDKNGKLLFLSTEKFIDYIVNGDCCLICGCENQATSFNEEHVLPQWILRNYNLSSKSVTLPNDSPFMYGRYTVPCCISCNLEMSRVFEVPLSELISGGYTEILRYLKNNDPWLIFGWLTLIFLKVHCKDKSFRYILDRSKESPQISDLYEWSDLHHLHCLARSFYTSCTLEKSVFGTLFVLPARTVPPHESFDFLTLYESQSILLRLGDIAFIAVLNDSGAAFSLLKDELKLSAPLSPLQLREILAKVSTINLSLKQRPKFVSKFDAYADRYSISANLPDALEIDDSYSSKYGEILHYCCREYIPFIKDEFGLDVEDDLRNGRWSFLFDENGDFVKNSL
jgi:hypothetical protein